MLRLLKNIVLLLNIVAVVALLMAYLAAYVSPADFWWPTIFGLVFPVLIIINLFFVLVWTFFRRRQLWLSVVIILLGYTHFENYVQFSPKKNELDGIKVVSHNVQSFYSYFEQEDRTNPEFVDFLNGQQADIICLQEAKLQRTGPLNPFKLKAMLKGMKHLQLAHTSRYAGPLTFTRFPIIHMGEIRFDKSNNIVIYTDIKTEGDTLRIYNCHLQSYRIHPQEYGFIDSLALKNDEKQIREMKNIGNKLRRAFVMRAAQAEEVAKHIDQSPYPVIVCGDFNDTPVSYAYHTMRDDLKDAFVESGVGLANSYVGRLPSFRIDYILHDKRYSSYNFVRHKIKLSDHYPISCTLVKEL